MPPPVPVPPVVPPPVEPVSPPVEPVSPPVELLGGSLVTVEGALSFSLDRFAIAAGGRNGSLGSNVSSEDPRSSAASSSLTLASAFRSLGSVMLNLFFFRAQPSVG